MGLFDNYAPQDFADRGGMLGRLLSLRPDLAQDQQDEDQPAQDQTAPALRQQPTGASTSGPLASAIGGALGDFYRQTILQPANDFSGYVNDAINDPAYFAHAIGPSLAGLGPIAGQLPAAVRGVTGALGALRPSAQPSYGDLTPDEIGQIQSVVNEAGRPLEVVGSAARGARAPKSDIDYVIPPSSMRHFEGVQEKLPGIDPKHGIIPGVGNINIGPVIRFEPK